MVARLWRRVLRLQFGWIVGKLLRFVTICVVPVFGALTWYDVAETKPELWPPAKLWEGILADWIFLGVVVVITILITFDPGRKLLDHLTRSMARAMRANYEEASLQSMRKEFLKRSNVRDFQAARELLLKAAEIELAEAIGMDSDSLKTNLLIVEPPSRIHVVARSKPGSELTTYQANPGLPGWTAIQENRTSVKSKVKVEDRPYRSIAATPIAYAGMAFGAITADSPDDVAFRGKAGVIDEILRPFCAAALLTLPNNQPYCRCPKRYTR